jgi:phospholipase/carboxylesterase
MDGADGPHQGRELVTAGTPLSDATAALVLLHGRGSSAERILETAEPFRRDGLALLAPQAADNSWYPESFLEPVERNEPGRSSSLRAVADAVAVAAGAGTGVPAERVLLLGFSQGACVAAEFVARRPARYGGLAVLSGGLMGETVDPADYRGDLEGTPVFLGCSDDDRYIPERRVHDSAAAFRRLNADVTERIYEGMGHRISDDEREHVSRMVAALVA